jgi:hypothetical protein
MSKLSLDSSISTTSSINDALIANFANDCANLVDIFSTAIALTENGVLRDLVLTRTKFPARMPFAARFGMGYAWIEFAQSAKPKVSRVPPEGAIQIDITALHAFDAEFRERFESVANTTRAREVAMGKLAFLFRLLPEPTRREAGELDPWIPLLEKPAYRICARMVDMLDNARRAVVPGLKTNEAPDDSLVGYWAIVQTIARLTLLASDPQARPWLVDMADSFEWRRWTPSVLLLRERVCWLAACAARSAIAFGPPVIDKYLSILSRSEHPMTTFDALFGLSAIGLSSPDELKSLSKEISSLRHILIESDQATPQLTDHLFSNCLDTLHAPDKPSEATLSVSQLLGWHGSSEGFATNAAMRADPTGSLPSGRIVGFAMLPLVVRAPKAAFYPIRLSPGGMRGFGVREIETLVRRAWTDAAQPSTIYH